MYILHIQLYHMIIINVLQEKNIDTALKKYKARVQKSKQLEILKDNQNFVKPSVKKREKTKKAIYSEKLKNGLI